MNESRQYTAVSCAMHSELELAIMHGKMLKIHYIEMTEKGVAADKKVLLIKPYDIITRGGDIKGEFLMASDPSGKLIEIRLDAINQFAIL